MDMVRKFFDKILAWMRMGLNYFYEAFKIFSFIIYYYLEALLNLLTPKSKKDLTDSLIVITGAGQGLGAEIAIKLAKLKANIALLDINKANLIKTKEFLKEELNAKVTTYICDISNDVQVTNTFDQIRKDFQKSVDILINNAGIVNCLPLEEIDNSSIIRTFEVNVFAQFWTIKNVLNVMKKKNSGHIVSISSIAGFFGNSNLTDYCASKFAVNGLMESLREELRKEGFDGIKLTTVCPITMNTQMFKRPTSRFQFLLPIVDPSIVAEKTVNAILSNRNHCFTVPSFILPFYYISYFVPSKVVSLIFDIFDYNVKPHN